jgi:hypothetical protein
MGSAARWSLRPRARTTAGRWVHQARIRGFLGPAVSRQAGEAKPAKSFEPEPPDESPSDTFPEGARIGQRLSAETKKDTTKKKPATGDRGQKRGRR